MTQRHSLTCPNSHSGTTRSSDSQIINVPPIILKWPHLCFNLGYMLLLTNIDQPQHWTKLVLIVLEMHWKDATCFLMFLTTLDTTLGRIALTTSNKPKSLQVSQGWHKRSLVSLVSRETRLLCFSSTILLLSSQSHYGCCNSRNYSPITGAKKAVTRKQRWQLSQKAKLSQKSPAGFCLNLRKQLICWFVF